MFGNQSGSSRGPERATPLREIASKQQHQELPLKGKHLMPRCYTWMNTGDAFQPLPEHNENYLCMLTRGAAAAAPLAHYRVWEHGGDPNVANAAV